MTQVNGKLQLVKTLSAMVGLMALATGGAFLMPSHSSPSTRIDDADTALFWREASGPAGERASAALPLYQAVFAHDRKAVTKLLDQGISPNLVLYTGRWSPLMVAVAYQDKDMVSLLLHRGANIDYISNDPASYIALGVALNSAMAEALRRGGGNEGAPNFSMFEYLLDAGANINVEFGYEDDIAKSAVSLGHMDIVNQLLARGYRLDLPGLERWLKARVVSKDQKAGKVQAIATIDRMLKMSEHS